MALYKLTGNDSFGEKIGAIIRTTDNASIPLDEATVLGWVKTSIGTDGVTAIEKVIDDNIAIINTPVVATGKPF